MKQAAAIYKYLNNLVFVPYGFLENGPIVSIEPIAHLNISSPDEELGITLSSTLNFSQKVTSSLEESNKVFKQLLQISKAKSNKNLVQNGQLISAHLKEGFIQLELKESSIKFKGFAPRKERQIVEFELQGLNEMEVGKTIKQLFSIKP